MLKSGIIPRVLRHAGQRLPKRRLISPHAFQHHVSATAALYRIVLGRLPDAKNIGHWSAQLVRGRTIADMAAEFIASAEFKQRNAGRNTRLVLIEHARAAGVAPHGRIDDHTPAALAATFVRQILATSPPPLAELFPGGVPFADRHFYNLWRASQPAPTALECEAMSATTGLPLMSFIMLTDRATPHCLAAAMDSVATQVSTNVEFIATGRDVPAKTPIGTGHACTFLRVAKGSSTAAQFNRALAACHGDFVVWLGRHDVLSRTAAYELAGAGIDADIVFADADRIDAAGQRHDPLMGAAWDEDALLGLAPPGIVAIRRTQLRTIGGMRDAIPGAEEWDMILRASLGVPAARIKRVPSTLASRRDAPPPPAAAPVRQRVVQDYLDAAGRRTAKAACHKDQPVRVVYALPAIPPLVSIVIPTRDRPALLQACLDGLLRATVYPQFEVLVIDNGSTDPEALATLQHAAADARIRVLHAPGPFNWSALNNLGVAEARGSVVVLLNNDVEIIEPGWLRELVVQALRPEVGIVGARLLYRDRSIQHAGIVLGPVGRATHIWRHAPAGQQGYLSQLATTRQVAALTGACLALRRAVYTQLGGLAEELPVTWSDVDLCLRVRSSGLRVLWTPHACLLHPEQSTRGPDNTPEAQARLAREQAWMLDRWGDTMAHDPFVSPNMIAGERDLLLATATQDKGPGSLSSLHKAGSGVP